MISRPDLTLIQSLNSEVAALKRDNDSLYEKCRLLLLDVARLEGEWARKNVALRAIRLAVAQKADLEQLYAVIEAAVSE